MSTPIAARVLGYAGLLPFGVLALTAALAPAAMAKPAAAGALAYGAVILSFMGGCRWGFACAGMGDGPRWAPLAISVAPALVGWAAFWAVPWIGRDWASLIIAAGFLALLLDDVAAARRGDAPSWWPLLRTPLTIGACLSLVILALAGV